jgi:hypothetical protein
MGKQMGALPKHARKNTGSFHIFSQFAYTYFGCESVLYGASYNNLVFIRFEILRRVCIFGCDIVFPSAKVSLGSNSDTLCIISFLCSFLCIDFKKKKLYLEGKKASASIF